MLSCSQVSNLCISLPDSMQFEGPNPLFSGFILVQAVLAGHTTRKLSLYSNLAFVVVMIYIGLAYMQNCLFVIWKRLEDMDAL